MRLIFILCIAFAPLTCTVVEEDKFEYEVDHDIGQGSTYPSRSGADSSADSSADTGTDTDSDTGTEPDSATE